MLSVSHPTLVSTSPAYNEVLIPTSPQISQLFLYSCCARLFSSYTSVSLVGGTCFCAPVNVQLRGSLCILAFVFVPVLYLSIHYYFSLYNSLHEGHSTLCSTSILFKISLVSKESAFEQRKRTIYKVPIFQVEAHRFLFTQVILFRSHRCSRRNLPCLHVSMVILTEGNLSACSV